MDCSQIFLEQQNFVTIGYEVHEVVTALLRRRFSCTILNRALLLLLGKDDEQHSDTLYQPQHKSVN